MTVFWFRRDLRLHDNKGLFEALTNSSAVLPIFIFDHTILSQLPKNDARVSFIHQELEKIQTELKKINKSLAVFYGEPVDVLKTILATHPITTVYTNHDYEPNALKRDLAVSKVLEQNNITFNTFKDQVIFEKNEVVKPDGSPYVVFTPYSKKWKENLSNQKTTFYNSENYLTNLIEHNYPFLSLEAIGFTASEIKVTPFDVSEQRIKNYEATRNFPALKGTSMLGTHLRFGTVSVREMVSKALLSENETFLNELIWREFFMQILWHFPHTVHKSFRSKYDAIVWDNSQVYFKKWCEGKTGYPMVDAGMRELNATGHMHNRVRMVVASFLCKHLLIDWRWGEAYFATKLLDYDQSSNVGNWQWAAGSGVDAAPYFRIFNPTEQLKKFDAKFEYVKKWVPKFQDFSYPKPIVVHEDARKRCLEIYKQALQE